MVQALVITHARAGHSVGKSVPRLSDDYHADLIDDKGRGLIILLHGPPGVGKTPTAECVAHLTRRPLFQLTCGDIGTTPEAVGKNLDDSFLLAHRWDYLLLLDEADVFLQERDRTSLTRNSLVSVFLRTLEYYSGILFLTTNREGTLDEAFKSRIHISLHYQRPTPKEWLLIWENNIKRVSKHYNINHDEVIGWAKSRFRELNWNGRQIKNAFQAATALARFAASGAQPDKTYEPYENFARGDKKITVRAGDFNKLAETSIGFDEYLQSILGFDKVEDRLFREGIRNDRFQHKQPLQSNVNSSSSYTHKSRQVPDLYQDPQRVRQQRYNNHNNHNNPHRQMQDGFGVNQSSGQFGRHSGSQHQQQMQGRAPAGEIEIEDPDDIWE